jgi:hypothetical protein
MRPIQLTVIETQALRSLLDVSLAASEETMLWQDVRPIRRVLQKLNIAATKEPLQSIETCPACRGTGAKE